MASYSYKYDKLYETRKSGPSFKQKYASQNSIKPHKTNALQICFFYQVPPSLHCCTSPNTRRAKCPNTGSTQWPTIVRSPNSSMRKQRLNLPSWTTSQGERSAGRQYGLYPRPSQATGWTSLETIVSRRTGSQVIDNHCFSIIVLVYSYY